MTVLKGTLERQEIEMISLKLQNNEWEGQMIATRSHNEALMERVQELALRVESLTFASKNVQRL